MVSRKGDGRMRNVILIGMPGCGKSTVGVLAAKALTMDFVDTDLLLQRKAGRPLQRMVDELGAEGFARVEEACVCGLEARGAVIATGGGCVTREENDASLHQNGVIFWLRRDLDKLPREGRPLSAGDLAAMYDKRRACYERFADHSINNNGTVEETLRQIMAALPEGE